MSAKESANILALSHVGIRSGEPEKLVNYYKSMLGLEHATTVDGRIYLRCNKWHHSLVIVPSEEPGFEHIAFTVDGIAGLQDAKQKIEDHGYKVTKAPNEPGQGEGIRFTGPQNIVIELIVGMEEIHEPLSTGLKPRKFGHINFASPNPKEFVQFWFDVLGFKLSDQVQEDMYWLHCNPDHHSLAVLKSDTEGVHHYAWEIFDFSDFRAFCDRQLELGVEMEYGPGRHGPGNNLFTYHLDTDGNRIELFTDIVQIWHDHQPVIWEMKPSTVNLWGPAPPESWFNKTTK